MVWAGIRFGGRTQLAWIQGNMTAQKYHEEVVEPVIVPHRIQMGPEFLLMHDNAPCHTARLASAALRDRYIEVLDWSAQSPDLNPIEHARDMLQ
jgi:hypothetical protein